MIQQSRQLYTVLNFLQTAASLVSEIASKKIFIARSVSGTV
jgi:hypothetical protein